MGAQVRNGGGGGSLLVDDVHDAVGDQHVGQDDLGAVDEDGAVLDAHCHVAATDGRDPLAVGQVGAVCDRAVDDVVLEDRGELVAGEVWQCGADVLERLVGRCEDGDVAERVDGVHQVGLCQCAGEGGEVGSNGSAGGVLGHGEDAIDDVNDTTGEVHVLSKVQQGTQLCNEAFTYRSLHANAGVQA